MPECIVNFSVPLDGCFNSVIHRAVQHKDAHHEDAVTFESQATTVSVEILDSCDAVRERHSRKHHKDLLDAPDWP